MAVKDNWNRSRSNLFFGLPSITRACAPRILYFGGVERPRAAPEGRAWRHLFDAHLTWHAMPWFSLLAHANGCFERSELRASAWAADAISARVRILEQLFFAARRDVFYEQFAERGKGPAAPISWPAPWVSSGTATFDHRPHERGSFRLEYRPDQAGADMYFGGAVVGDGGVTSFVMNRASQDGPQGARSSSEYAGLGIQMAA